VVNTSAAGICRAGAPDLVATLYRPWDDGNNLVLCMYTSVRVLRSDGPIRQPYCMWVSAYQFDQGLAISSTDGECVVQHYHMQL
jgi:hypothetical protein